MCGTLLIKNPRKEQAFRERILKGHRNFTCRVIKGCARTGELLKGGGVGRILALILAAREQALCAFQCQAPQLQIMRAAWIRAPMETRC